MLRPFLMLVVSAAILGCSSSQAAQSVAAAPGLHTLPGIQPPQVTITHPASAGVSPGLVFVAEKGSATKPGGPMILDNKGHVLWFHQLVSPQEATDFRTQTYEGKPVLTWWQGTSSKAGIGRGRYMIYDTSYHHIATVRAGNGLQGDLHEFQLTPRGTAYITAYQEVPADLMSVGGPKNGWVYDSVVQEIDIATGKVVFQWKSLDHVPLTESLQANNEPAVHATKKRPLDYFHVNSIADAPGGRILVSGRNTSALYLLARDGHIVWRLGGKRSDFGPPAAVTFRFQHNARLHPGGILTLFDNGAIPKLEPYTRPMVMKIDVATKKVSIVKAFAHPSKISSPYEGNLELLPGGGAFVGWGGIRKATEFDSAGKVIFEIKLPFGDTYRAYRATWSGKPAGAPRVAVSGGQAYASWNGRVDIDRWDVLAGPDAQHLTRVAGHAFAGLETAIPLAAAAEVVEVRAVDAKGRTLGVSRPAGS